MATKSHAEIKARASYSLTKYVFSTVWIFSGITLAQLADGYRFEFSSALIFSAVMAAIAGRIKSAIALGAYLSFTILLAHFLIALYSLSYSTDQFFPSLWSALDLMLMAMMWSSPILVLLADFFDQRLVDALTALLISAITIIKAKILLPVQMLKNSLFVRISSLADQWQRRVNSSRGPPLFVVA